ncbi:MAG: YegS/Rv2252/BmrU family lipid kinase [Oscillospiraceae bacterium]|nr:YegS/Rv2252/BmrU family lipid kinase [Oscillospiraceae bacterium]
MKHLFIVNPKAGGKDCSEDVRQRVAAALAHCDDEWEVYVTKAPMDAVDKILADAQSGAELRVYACGGDGTFNECVCGAAERSNVAVCPFPNGTGNDFCRMFGEEKDLFRDLDALLAGTVRPIDVIDCNGRYSVNICSVGIDARIGTDVHKYSGLPLIGGATGYVVSAAVNVFKGINSKMRVRCGEYAGEGGYALVAACNGRFYGGGFNPSLHAMPDDGILDIYIVPKINILTLATLIGKYASGQADSIPDRIYHLRGTELTIDFDEDNVVNIDGEAMFAKSVHMKLIPGGLKLIVPRGMRFFEKGEG